MRRGFTLIELLITVVILGIASAIIIPQMGEAGQLRVQGAVRSVVSDITFAQADAVAFQEKRAIVFDTANSIYTLVSVPGTTIDLDHNTMYDGSRPGGKYVSDIKDARFGNCRIATADFGAGSTTLIFDALGGPLATAGGNTAGQGGTVRINGVGQSFVISVEAFTGRVTVAQDRAYTGP